MDSIFLSASIPVPGRRGYRTADPLLIHAAVRAFLTLALGRRRIVWGGHPSITPMVEAACRNFGLEYFDCVSLYQSRYYETDFPVNNDQFDNLTLVPAGADALQSLAKLRHTMFQENSFVAALFIGGMEGIREEFDLLKRIQPDVTRLALYSPGGVAAELATELGDDPTKDDFATDFTGIFVNGLGIDPLEERLVSNLAKRSPPRP